MAEEPYCYKLILLCLVGLQILPNALQEASIEIASFVIIKLIGRRGGESQWTRRLDENKQWEIFPHCPSGAGIEKGRDTDKSHYAKRKETNIKGHLLCDFIYLKFRIGKSIKTESRLISSWDGGGSGVTAHWVRDFF